MKAVVTEWNYKAVLKHLQLKDKKAASLLEVHGELEFTHGREYFEALVGAIISQQVSIKAAESIFAKFKNGVGGKMKPKAVATRSIEELRSFGLSPQKAGYISDLAKHFVDDPKRFEHLDKFSDEEVIAALVSIKGIGKWTAQMFLMFTLGRKDVFAPDDLGLKNAMMRLYKWRTPPDRTKLEKQAAKWSPYRTIVSRYLWYSLSH